MGYWDTLAERIVPSFNAIVRSWKVMLNSVEDIPTPDRKQRLTTIPVAHYSNPSCFKIMNCIHAGAAHLRHWTWPKSPRTIVRDVLRRNKLLSLEAFYAKRVLGIFSEPPLQGESLNFPQVTLAKMKKTAENFCPMEAGRKSVIYILPFQGLCYRFWSYSWSLLF